MARPSSINQVLRTVTSPDGKTTRKVTVADQIVQSITAGNYFEQSCAAAGVGKSTGYRWLREGALAARRLEAGGTAKKAKLTANDLACMEFWHAVVEAEAMWEVAAVTTLEQLGRGGLTHVTETERRDPQGKLIDRTTKTETLAPDVRVLLWRLERKFPERYGKRVEVTTSVPDPLTRDDRAEAIADQIESYMKGREDAAAEATTAADGD